VNFQFGVDGDLIDFRQGDLDIGIQIEQPGDAPIGGCGGNGCPKGAPMASMAADSAVRRRTPMPANSAVKAGSLPQEAAPGECRSRWWSANVRRPDIQ
jgi:hypothetical protein